MALQPIALGYTLFFLDQERPQNSTGVVAFFGIGAIFG